MPGRKNKAKSKIGNDYASQAGKRRRSADDAPATFSHDVQAMQIDHDSSSSVGA